MRAPTSNGNLLQRLDLLLPKDEDEAYTKEFSVFKRKLMSIAAAHPKLKLVAGEPLLQQQQQQRFMSGKDLAELVRFLVGAANANMFGDVQVFMNHFSTVRVRY